MDGIDDTGNRPALAERIEKAVEYKTMGNECYKAKKYNRAIGKYHRALLQLKNIHDSKQRNISSLFGLQGEQNSSSATEEVQNRITALQADCYNNLAVCILQQENPNYKRIIEYCDCVLKTTPANRKAIYRKGVALYHMGCYSEALEMLFQVKMSTDGVEDQAVKRYLILSSQELEKQKDRMKKNFKRMFENSACSAENASC